MTKVEARVIREELKRLGLSQRAAAEALGITERTMRRYCSGEASVPLAIKLALHLLELAIKDEKQKRWLAEHGVRLAYVRLGGTDLDVTEIENSRLDERISRRRAQAKKVAKPKR